jgi:hypothetical protein
MRGRDRQGTPYGSFGDRRAQDPAGLPRTSLALGASPALAGGLDLSVHCGVDEYDAVELKSGLCGVNGSSHPKDFSTYVGATAIIWRGVAELGAIGELGRPGKNGTTSLLGALGGLGFDAGSFRLEALGELGAHRYGDLLNGSYVMERSKSEAWLVSAGLRPGLSVRFGPRDMLLAGVWAFARWDVTHENVHATLANSNKSTYGLGGSQFGASARMGLSL